jgi:hypothetical protein
MSIKIFLIYAYVLFFQVKQVQDQVLAWMASGIEVPMCTARPGWQSITLQQVCINRDTITLTTEHRGRWH